MNLIDIRSGLDRVVKAPGKAAIWFGVENVAVDGGGRVGCLLLGYFWGTFFSSWLHLL
jgi:hypothetical protein